MGKLGRVAWMVVMAGGPMMACAPSPTLIGVSPGFGPTSGGTQVLIKGTSLERDDAVSFGGVPAPIVTYTSAASLMATTPAHVAGTVDVVLTTPDGETATLSKAFTFVASVAPVTLTSITPSSGSTTGGTLVTLMGMGFVSGDLVTFDSLAATGVTFFSSTTLTAVAPRHVAGSVNVAVIDPTGNTSVLPNAFLYQTVPTALSITAVSPPFGAVTGGTPVTLSGTGFSPGDLVGFGGVMATGVTFNSTVSLTATTPPHAAGVVDVTVTNTSGQTAALANAFTY